MLAIKKNIRFLLIALLLNNAAIAQKNSYKTELKNYQRDYVKSHEVVLKEDKKYIQFFPVNKSYRVIAKFDKIEDTVGFIMKTSGTKSKKYFRYGTIHFNISNEALQLTIYQSEQLMTDSTYKNYLFMPFTDLSSGEESYAGGRYLDFEMKDIKMDSVIIDFNKVYNPYCAYTTGYNCPIPPRENDLPVSIRAGEKAYAKKVH